MTLKKDFHTYELKLKVITPVHIGNGDSTVNMDSLDEGDYIYVFHFEDLADLANSKGFINLQNAKKQKQIIDKEIYEYKIANPSQEYANERDFYIRGGNGYPYIPGSSLKGCILSAFFTQSEIGPDSDKNQYKNFALCRGTYVSVGDAIATEKNCTTMYKLTNKNRYKTVSASKMTSSRFQQPARGKPKERFLNPCEMLNVDTEFSCLLKTEKLTAPQLIEAMINHYMKHARFTNMEPSFQKFLEKEKEKGGYDFLMPLGKHKGREFNLEDDYYKSRLSQTKKILADFPSGVKLGHDASLEKKRRITNDGIAIKRRALPKNVPIGWVGVHITEQKG